MSQKLKIKMWRKIKVVNVRIEENLTEIFLVFLHVKQ